MRKLTSKEIQDLAFDSGLQVCEENGYKGECDEVLSYKEFCKQCRMDTKDDDSFEAYKNSIEYLEIFEIEN